MPPITPVDSTPTTMAELELTLWCYVEGDRNYFSVSIPPNHSIHELKTRIYAKRNNSFVGCDAMDLNLAKVRYITISVNIDVINPPCWLVTSAD